MRTQVGIVGAGPAGLLLSHLLHGHGIESIVLESHSRAYVESRVRAGVLEHGSVETLIAAGLGERLKREGMTHRGFEITWAGTRRRIDLHGLTSGRAIAVYGQHEVVTDMIAARLAAGGTVLFEAPATDVADLNGPRPRIRFERDGRTEVIDCDFIAGCDGFHGICRAAIPAGVLSIHERDYPFGWLGILAEAPPASDELVYARHRNGFALFSMRSPEITRLYLQCAPEEDLAAWPDTRIWDELHLRLEQAPGFRVNEGQILQKGVTGMRSFVAAPMRYGRLFLAGDAAHIVPPTGAKGMNLAIADVRVLARALIAQYREGRTDLFDAYSETCLRRVWLAQRFSLWMTSMLHRFPGADAFQEKIQDAELDFVTRFPEGARALAVNYVGLPYDDG
jgi:p-hydroxybenzoate 3-monooxygenase